MLWGGYVENWLSGACKDLWRPGITAWVYKAAQELQNSGAEKWGGFGGEVSHGFPPLTLSQHGPITYTIYACFRALVEV